MKRLNKEERRNQLIQAAQRAFGKKGYHHTQVSDIIQEAGVARGTFYLYFEGKREIFDELVKEIFQRVQKVIRPINTQDILQVSKDILGNIERATDLLYKNPIYSKIFFSDAVGLDEAFDERLRHYYQLIIQKIEGGLQQGQKIGLIREGGTKILALCLMGSLKELLYQAFLKTYRPSLKQMVKEVYHIVLHATVKPEWIEPLQVQMKP